MMELKTTIKIDAPVERIWRILMNFEEYPNWNPFVKEITGNAVLDNQITVVLQQPEGKKMTFKPRVTKLEKYRHFEWLGHLLFRGLFDGRHYFKLTKITDHQCLFEQGEIFNGLLVPLFRKDLETKTKRGFELMNDALKARAERHTSS